MTVVDFPGNLPTSPAPEIDPETAPFWEAAEEGRLVLPVCTDCDRPFWFPRGFCPRCHGPNVVYRDASGRGTIYSYSIVAQGFGAWAAVSPFVVAWVRLEEGVTVSTNIVEVDRDQLEIGAPVVAVFETVDAGIAPALRFRPA